MSNPSLFQKTRRAANRGRFAFDTEVKDRGQNQFDPV
jgi:hypothetical protein